MAAACHVRTILEGEFLDTVIGIPNSRTEIVMLRPPGGGTGLELSRFIRPDRPAVGSSRRPAGLRRHSAVSSSLPGVIGELADALAGGVEYRVGDRRGDPGG